MKMLKSMSSFCLLIFMIAITVTGCSKILGPVGNGITNAGTAVSVAIQTSLPNAASKLQPLKEIDPEVVKLLGEQGAALNDRIKEINQTIANGISANLEVGATDELQKVVSKLSTQLANLKVGVDDKTLSQIGGYLDIIQRGVKVGFDKETLLTLTKMVDELATQPEKWKQTITSSANALDHTAKDIAEELRTTIVQTQNSAKDVTASFGVELKCNADFATKKAGSGIDDIIGSGLIDKIFAKIAGRSSSERPLISGVCQVIPGQIELRHSGGRLIPEDIKEKPILNIFGYGFTDKNPPTLQILDGSGAVVSNFAQVEPDRASNYLVSFNLQGMDFSAAKFRYRLAIVWPNLQDTTRIPLLLPPAPTDTPIPPTLTPTATAISQAELSINDKAINIRSGPSKKYDVIGQANPGETYKVIGKNQEGTWLSIALGEDSGWVSGALVNAKNVATALVLPDPPLPLPTPTDTPTATTCPAIKPPAFSVAPKKITSKGNVDLSWTGNPLVEKWIIKEDNGDSSDVGLLTRIVKHPEHSTTYLLIAVHCGGEESVVGQVSVTVNILPPTLTDTPTAPPTPTIPREEYVDGGTLDQGMHVCPKEYAISGVHVGNNQFLCRRVMRPGDEDYVVSIVDSGTLRSGMHACPPGMYMRGLHVGNNLLLCSYDSRTGVPSEWAPESEFDDKNSLEFNMHACPGFPDKITYMTGIHVGQNRFLCAVHQR